MIVQTNLPLSVSISSSSKDAQKALSIIEGFIKTLPVIVDELARRSLIASREIAPVGNYSFQSYDSTFKKSKSKKSHYSTGKFTNFEGEGGELRDSIYLNSSNSGFSLHSGGTGGDNEIKAIVQEFGYEYENYWGPYPPNPKRKPHYSGTAAGRIRGLGYLRVAMIIAADSLNSDKGDSAGSISYVSVPSRSDVRNYQQVVERRLTQVISKFLTAYAKGNLTTLPGYYQNKVAVPTDTISKYASSFGNVQSLKINVPIKIEYQGQTLKYAGLNASSFLR